jgi:hypothetical protein
METLTRLVSESLARHGFERPIDYRRLQWSRWFRCQSHHSLLLVPSRPGVFALAEEIADFDSSREKTRRMLAVTQFFQDDDMAFVLDRMLSRNNPMRAHLMSGHYFARYVVIGDESQRRSVCAALNQWIASQSLANQPLADPGLLSPRFENQTPLNALEKMSGIGPHFAASLELTPATEYVPPANRFHEEDSRV